MGIKLVGDALNPDWHVLSDRARLILIHMSYVAKDTSSNGHAAGVYWAGHKTLMINVLGIDPDQLTEQEFDAADAKIQRAMRELRHAGAVTVLRSASRGSNTEYEVTPGRFPGTVASPDPVTEPAEPVQRKPHKTQRKPTRPKGTNGHAHPVHEPPLPVDNSTSDDVIVQEWGTSRVPL